MLIGLSGILSAQNLVINSDFEIPNICHEYKESCSPLAWRSTNLKLFGYNKDKQNGNYISLLLFNGSKENDRKFAQTELICPLEKGQDYLIRLQIKPDQFRIEQIHIGFQDSMILSKTVNAINAIQNFVSLKVPEDVEQGKWLELEMVYQSKGEEKYLIIGNLLNDSLTIANPIDKKKYRKYLKYYSPAHRVNYGIDRVSVSPLNGKQEFCEHYEMEKNRIAKDSSRHSLKRIKYESIKPDLPTLSPKEEIVLEPQNQKSEILKKQIINDVSFKFNEAKLINKSIVELNVVVEKMNLDTNLQAIIIGYTDSVGSKAYNLKLSLERAIAVKEYLVKNNISEDRLKVEGRGENQPISPGYSEEDRKRNRRVEIEFFY